MSPRLGCRDVYFVDGGILLDGFVLLSAGITDSMAFVIAPEPVPTAVDAGDEAFRSGGHTLFELGVSLDIRSVGRDF